MSDTKRHLVIVDIETTGLRSEDFAVEIAWLDVDTGQRACFIPPHSQKWALDFGEPVALEMNGYRERIAGRPHDDGTELARLFDVLSGNTLGGSNPTFDSAELERLFVEHVRVDDMSLATPWRPWHHRMADLSAYAAGVLGIDVRELPGLAAVCERLGVQPGDHTAERDVDATAACFALLAGRRPVRWTL